MDKNLVRISLNEGKVEDLSGRNSDSTIGLNYNADGEVYINKCHIQHFNIDERERTVEIVFPMVSSELEFRVLLSFSTLGGEFQRVKRELLA